MEQYLTEDNYRLAVRNAVKHKGGQKRKYHSAHYHRDHMEELLPEMMEYAKHFHNGKHKPIQIYDGIRRKKRTIIVPNMREQVIHHMLINVLQPIFMKSMYEHSYGSIPGRGAHLAKKQVERWIRHGGRNVKYCLKMDIRKYFDSVPHDILKAKLASLIKDQDFLAILNEIVDVIPGGRGIPIGFYTSQWIANWYLTELDHYIKEDLKADYYVRYMDDMVIFGGNKRRLNRIRELVEQYLQDNLGLSLKDNWQVFLFDYIDKHGVRRGRDLDFMGFRFYRDKTTLRQNLMLKMSRKARRICRKPKKTIYDCRQMLSYLGWIDCTDTYAMYKRRVKPFVNFQQLKRIESSYQRRANKACGIQQKMEPV